MGDLTNNANDLVHKVRSRLKSRKLWATVGVLGLATFELHAGHLQSADWVSVIKVVIPVWLLSQAAVDAFVKKIGGAE
jgi:hypothetical protein